MPFPEFFPCRAEGVVLAWHFPRNRGNGLKINRRHLIESLQRASDLCTRRTEFVISHFAVSLLLLLKNGLHHLSVGFIIVTDCICLLLSWSGRKQFRCFWYGQFFIIKCVIVPYWWEWPLPMDHSLQWVRLAQVLRCYFVCGVNGWRLIAMLPDEEGTFLNCYRFLFIVAMLNFISHDYREWLNIKMELYIVCWILRVHMWIIMQSTRNDNAVLIALDNF